MKRQLAPFTETTIFDWDTEAANERAFTPPDEKDPMPRQFRSSSRQQVRLMTTLLIVAAATIGVGLAALLHAQL